ncbi:MAG: beta-lactamase family protein [Anaerolineae bacterium]|jgi:CubicO group peptidase (beta-lactamase class C family)|nr:beta-lactamase family protein [Anaerolineae bacterium]
MQIDTRAIHDLFADWQREDAPGGVLGIIEHGELRYSAAFGMADLERPAPLTTDSVFDVASVSKQFTAFCMALLAEDKRLSLADSIHDHLPELPAYGDVITIRQMLHHTSGLPDYLELMDLAGLPLENDYPPARVFRLLRAHPYLNGRPGERFLYSNTGYVLAAALVQRLTGQSLAQFAHERIFQPLGMTQTRFGDDFSRPILHRAIGYAPINGQFAIAQSLMTLVGDGKLLTTLADLARWDANFSQNRLGGGQDLIRLMVEPGRLNDGTPIEYALGLQLHSYRGLSGIRHAGAWMGYKAEFMRFPEAALTIVCLANRRDAYPAERCRRVLDRLLQDRLAPLPTVPVPQDAPPAAITARLGRYLDLAGRITWQLQWEGGRLWMVHYSWARFGLQEQSEGYFVSVIGPVTLTLRFAGDEAHVTLEGFAPAVLRFLPDWSPANRDEYAGGYRHDALQVEHHIRRNAQSLEVVVGDARQPIPLEPIAPDIWIAPNTFYYAFERDAEGQIVAVAVSSERVRDLRFRRLP